MLVSLSDKELQLVLFATTVAKASVSAIVEAFGSDAEQDLELLEARIRTLVLYKMEVQG